MRIGVSLSDPSGPDPMTGLRDQLQQAAGDGFSSAWVNNIFGLDALTALAVAEYFRDELHENVLFLIDNVFRFVQAGGEVSGLLGRLPSRVGYQPTLATEIAELEERFASVRGAAITSIQAVYVPADDFTDPAVAETFAHLDSSIVLDRGMASEGLYPAIDPLASTSILLDPRVLGADHYALAQEARKTIAHYRELQEIISLLGIDSVYMPMPRRRQAWERLARDLDPKLLAAMTRMISLKDVRQAADDILAGKVRGRLVVKIGA